MIFLGVSSFSSLHDFTHLGASEVRNCLVIVWLLCGYYMVLIGFQWLTTS